MTLVTAPGAAVDLIKCHDAQAYAIRGQTWVAAQTLWAVSFQLDQEVPSGAIETLRVSWDQSVTVLLRIADENDVTATVMGWPEPGPRAIERVN